MSDAVVPTTVVVSTPRCPTSPPIAVSASSPGVFPICFDAEYRAEGVATPPNYAISVQQLPPGAASLKAVFKANDPADHSDDAFLVFAKSRLGSSYWPIGYRAYEVSHKHNSRWAAVAESGLTLHYKGCPDAQASVAMAANDVFQELCPDNSPNSEATGFEVYSSPAGQNFALISGADCGTIPSYPFPFAGCDTLLEMMPPTEWAGTEYFVTEFPKYAPPDPPGDIVRILAPDLQQTYPISITVTTPPPSIGASNVDPRDAHPCPDNLAFDLLPGEFCDLHIKGGARIAASGQILVGQFALSNGQTTTGDSSFVMVTPTLHHVCGHRFYSFSGFDWNLTGYEDGTYVNIVSLSASVEKILLDGETLDSPNTHCHNRVRTNYPPGPTGSYAWVRCRLDNPPASPATGEQHVLQPPTGSDVPFAAYAYGLRQNGAYSYATGTAF